MLAVSLFCFGVFKFMGDPVIQMVDSDTPLAEIEAIRDRMGLNDNLLTQYATFIKNSAQLDFGRSYELRRPVTELIVEALPATAELVILSTIIATFFGLLIGVYTAVHPKGAVSAALRAGSLIGVSVPTFLMAILAIYWFSVSLGWLPSYGRGEVVSIGWWTTGLLTKSGLLALILPVLTLSINQVSLIVRLVRSEMLDILRADYIRFARARGLSERAINFRHALKNALIPVVTIVGLQIGSLLAFAVVTESVFQWPGMGSLFIRAIQSIDIPVMSAYLMLVALIIVIVNIVLDFIYVMVDPRLALAK